MVVFRGTQPDMFLNGRLSEDWLSNIDFMDAVTIENSTCHVHQGYYNAYQDFEYKLQIESFVQSCQTDCPQCQVVLTGHSQGGAIASVVGVLWKDKNPYVETFGAPQALGEGCLDFVVSDENNGNDCRWTHFVMSRPATTSNGLSYDAVPMIFPHLFGNAAKYAPFGFIGHEIFLSTDDPTSTVYTGFNRHRFAMPYTGEAHAEELYSTVFEALSEITQSTAKSIPTTGFVDGTICNRDDECRSGFCQQSFFLSRRRCAMREKP